MKYPVHICGAQLLLVDVFHQRLVLLILAALTLATGSMPSGHSRCFVEKEKFRVGPWFHQGSPLAPELEHTMNPELRVPLTNNNSIVVMENASIAEQSPASGGSNNLSEGSNSILQRHNPTLPIRALQQQGWYRGDRQVSARNLIVAWAMNLGTIPLGTGDFRDWEEPFLLSFKYPIERVGHAKQDRSG